MKFSYGRLILTARQRVGESAFLDGAEAELIPANVPIDRGPLLLELFRKTGDPGAFLTFRPEKYLEYLSVRGDSWTL
jgi:hypothetical protein